MKIAYIRPEPLPVDALGEIEIEEGTRFVPIDMGNLIELTVVQGLNAPRDRNGEPKLANKTLIGSLQSAIKKFNEYYGLPETTKEARANDGLRTPEKQYELMQERCGCPPVTDLPDTINNKDLQAQCGACQGCSAGCLVERVGGVWQAPQVSHFTGMALDLSTSRGAKIKCASATDEEKNSAGAIKTNEYGSSYCVPKEQQLLIKAMLENNFCVGLRNTSGLRESWHFEYMSGGVRNSVFCTNNLSDPTLQKLYWTQK